jgi:hypothetical protein
MLTVHVRVTDAATGRPTPVRLALRDSSGAYHAPFGRLADFATGPGEAVGGSVRLGPARFAHVGPCEVRLPPGTIHVEAHKGPEYLPIRREVHLGAGQISLRLTVHRWTDWSADGWLSGDVRCHELSPHAALLEGEAEGLAFVNLLAFEHPSGPGGHASFSNLLDFSGMAPAVATDACSVVVNTLNSHHVLGTVALLNSHRPVFPLCSGGPGGVDDWSVADWCDQCHRKKGLVVWPDLPRLTPDRPQGEALASLVLGKVDAWEVAGFFDIEPAVLADWYRLLDCGLHVTLVGASGKNSNARALGSTRTYARLWPDDAPDYAAWIEAIRAGRTFVTNGPLLSLTVEEQGPGATARAHGPVVRARAEAQSATPFDQVEVLAGSAVVVAKPTSGDRLRAAVEMEVPIEGAPWIAARCWGRDRLLDGQCVFAHTSPVYVEPPEGSRPIAAEVGPLLRPLDDTLHWVRHSANCPTEHHREHLLEVLQAARNQLLRRQRA